jgi:hypothetical protein
MSWHITSATVRLRCRSLTMLARHVSCAVRGAARPCWSAARHRASSSSPAVVAAAGHHHGRHARKVLGSPSISAGTGTGKFRGRQRPTPRAASASGSAPGLGGGWGDGGVRSVSVAAGYVAHCMRTRCCLTSSVSCAGTRSAITYPGVANRTPSKRGAKSFGLGLCGGPDGRRAPLLTAILRIHMTVTPSH